METINKLQLRKEKKAVLNNSRTRSTKAAANEQYTVANRAVKKSVKTDKVNFIDSMAKEAEDAAARGNIKQLYDTTRKLAGKFKQAERPIKDTNGLILTREEDQMGRGRDHFEELLNRPAPSNPPNILLASEVLEVNCERPDREEIRKAISLLKTGKAPGPDEIPAEAIKAHMETSIEMLHDLIEDMGHRRNTNRMERRVPCKDSKERRPTTMQELQRNYAAISAWKSPQQNHIGNTET